MIEEIDSCISRGDVDGASALIIRALETGHNLSEKGILYANVLMLTTKWSGINALLPANTNSFVSSGWVNSLIAGRPVNADGNAVPWFTYPAIDFLDSIVRPDWKVLEWGSGNSTLWWASRVASILAVENDENWFNEIRNQMPSNATLRLETEESRYVGAASAADGDPFDAIVVDGRFRNACAQAAIERVSENGVIIFDNSDRFEYQEGHDKLARSGFYRLDFWGLVPSYFYKNCTSIHFKDPELLKPRQAPHAHQSSVGVSCEQSLQSLRR